MHLSKPQIDLYHRRALSSTELLAVDDHLQVCDACRLELARGEPLEAALAAWETLLGEREERAPASSRRRRWASLTAGPALGLVIAAALGAFLIGLMTIPLCRAAARHLRGGARHVAPARARRTSRDRPSLP